VISALIDSRRCARLQFKRNDLAIAHLLNLNIFKTICPEVRRWRSKIRERNLDIEPIAATEGFVVNQRRVRDYCHARTFSSASQLDRGNLLILSNLRRGRCEKK
jgi:hypothetical protein